MTQSTSQPSTEKTKPAKSAPQVATGSRGPVHATPAQAHLGRLVGREPTVDVLDPTNALPGFTAAGVEDEAGAIEEAKRIGRAVTIPGHPESHVARPDGSVGPYQPK